jgi:hypothetical protein
LQLPISPQLQSTWYKAVVSYRERNAADAVKWVVNPPGYVSHTFDELTLGLSCAFREFGYKTLEIKLHFFGVIR